MKAERLLDLLAARHRRAHLIGSLSAGAVAGLDLEGRLFLVHDGEVLSRIDERALDADAGATGYPNPGGDGLWPAPEGTRLGYHYATGAWRVPPAVTGARYRAESAGAAEAVLTADLDLVNAQGLGVPVRATRTVTIAPAPDGLVAVCHECFTYLGTRALTREDCLLAPWTLSQFDCGPGCETVFPDAGPDCVLDLYGPSDVHRQSRDGLWRVRTAGDARFQLALDARVPWIELRRPDGLRVRRSATPPEDSHRHIDIADRPPNLPPAGPGCRYSVFNDGGAGFMELEAAGGMPAVLLPGTRLALTATTTVSRA